MHQMHGGPGPGFGHDPRTGMPLPPAPPPIPLPPHGPPAPPWPPHGPGFGPGPKVRRGDVRAAVLALLAEQPRNGYQIIQEIASRSHGIWKPSPGSVYPALSQLEDEGLVHAADDGGRRVYRLTEEGRTYVAEHEKELAKPWAAVTESVSEEMVDLRSLLGQVGMAMGQVVQAGTPTQHNEARRVLADARRALYRILAEDDTTDPDDEEDQ